MTEAELDEIERRAAAAGPGEGLSASLDPEVRAEAVAAFVAHAREDVLRLVAAIRRSERVPGAELDGIVARAEAAGPLPWDVFLESDGGHAGCSLIWVGGAVDGEPDLYLWRDGVFAGDEDFTFIAAARTDIPRLVEAL
jgi:hypothetical protein